MCEGADGGGAASAGEQAADSDARPSTTTAGKVRPGFTRRGSFATTFVRLHSRSSVLLTERHISIQTKLEGLEMLVDLDGGE